MGKNNINVKVLEPLMHVMAWGILFGFPFFFLMNQNGDRMEWDRILHHSIVPLSFCIIFYLNYFLLIPELLFRDKGKRWIFLNILAIFIMSVFMQVSQTALGPGKPDGRMPQFRIDPGLLFFIRDMASLVIVTGLSAAIRLSKRWIQTENARKEEERRRIEAERGRTEAELKNLRNQLNPHFLLNTLNNIYALIEFDKDKAQAAVSELSRLLRYVLYDNQQEQVPLRKETEFIKNYISLMKIRLSQNVTVETQIDIPQDSETEIAPMLFISLIENAFKHGISPVGKSFIKIHLAETDDAVICDIQNSCHPKNKDDKSGSGIGLGQVSRRLELLYPGRYEWEKGEDQESKTYSSVLKIYKERKI